MNAYILPNYDIRYLDEALLDEDGLLLVLSYAQYTKFPLDHLQVWANKRGIYCLPTTELIEFLKQKIDGRKAIEICAGNGAIGRALKIPMTDSYIQTSQDMQTYYKAIGQQPITPPSDVYEFEANEAVDALKPKMVIGSYVTQKFQPGDEGPPLIGSSVYGVDEQALIPKVETYICVGNDQSHGDKRINKLPHETFRFEWIVTRGVNQSLNNIKIWTSS